jgi:hypothetical protein
MATKKDFTQVAHAVFAQATGAAPKKAATAKQLAGRAGGLKGGKSRMAALSEDERRALALKAVAARKAPASSKTGATKVTKER